MLLRLEFMHVPGPFRGEQDAFRAAGEVHGQDELADDPIDADRVVKQLVPDRVAPVGPVLEASGGGVGPDTALEGCADAHVLAVAVPAAGDVGLRLRACLRLGEAGSHVRPDVHGEAAELVVRVEDADCVRDQPVDVSHNPVDGGPREPVSSVPATASASSTKTPSFAELLM